MVFKWKINRPAFQSAVNGAEVMHPGIETEFETGSIAEAHGIFTDSGTALSEMFGRTLMAGASGLALSIGGDEQIAETNEQTGGGEAGNPAKKERKKRNSANPAPETATAPDPVVIPGTEAPPTAPVAAAANIAPPPPPPPAPPAAAAPPPTGVLAGKVIADLDRRATGAADGGQALADWLSTSGITVKGATYTEALAVLRLVSDEKLAPIAAQLGVA